MSGVRLSEKHWKELEKWEYEMTLKRGKITRKSEAINLLLDEALKRIRMNKDGSLYIDLTISGK